jgi:phosphoserine phosphatase
MEVNRYIGDIKRRKESRILKAIAEKEGIHINQTIAVGDGAMIYPCLI